ncbi:hypothetical protein MHSWG343_06110 [Candidatus Mycoplasma haematohominis]|uniref:Uncharacterized protein n=2 Tax=Candidatus Mycoplasma haematohominis TaxID=1494318 RepID=A0A478FRF4_9MOLU|nr:hypothetical protein MHSWG343_06110 [Candidatus Mycoplasma haemohominis]
MTLSVAAIGGNSAIGIYFNEFLRLYLFMTGDSDELSTLDSSSFNVTPIRKKTETVAYKGNSTNVDPRKSTTATTQTMSPYSAFMMGEPKRYSNKLAYAQDEQAWWDSIYEIRIYIMKNQDIAAKKVRFKKGFSKEPIRSLSKAIHINQFCKYVSSNASKYREYKDLFWLMCSIDGKDPNEKGSNGKISKMEKATFPTENEQTQSITYMTLEQAKKKQADKSKFKNIQTNKYVVYDYSEEWWKWSYKYRFQKDQADESSAYPLSEQFKKVQEGWDDKLQNQSLNRACKDFYEKDNKDQNEKEDAARYCSADGK